MSPPSLRPWCQHDVAKWNEREIRERESVKPVSESESERQRARNWTSESERDFSRERATIHMSESKRVKFKTARDFSFYSAIPWSSDCSDVCSI